MISVVSNTAPDTDVVAAQRATRQGPAVCEIEIEAGQKRDATHPATGDQGTM